jgi:predicted transcriptional regulator
MMDDELKEQLDRLTNGVELDRAQWIIADILERFDERLRALEQRDGDWRKP